MESNTTSVIEELFSNICNNKTQWITIVIVSALVWKLLRNLYQVVYSAGGIHYVNTERSPMKMTACHNPFFFDLNVNKSSYSGVECTLKSEKDCYIRVFWGVPIYLLFELLNRSWCDMKYSIITCVQDDSFSKKCICYDIPRLLHAGEEKNMYFKPGWNVDSSAFESPEAHTRQIYPFVVIMTLMKDVDMEPSLVVTMANVVHVPDKVLKLQSQLIGQYVKLSSGPVGLIKNIFLSSPATSSNGGITTDLCIACYHRAVSLVLLPCRHACLCAVCFEFCETCPICRGPANFYFELSTVPRQ
ncbi:cell growth regulator with RING finger domain protein 1-like [Uloborus diversus]|uniref:cell growth regulator with RING finger domain protein 1-like n=1 Tax=Uloborus diversus TaxID=327109 RepID=UPI0024099BC3|nr:cell growth regulator with RING finger domain protein 1-like [Uloborus diversus]